MTFMHGYGPKWIVQADETPRKVVAGCDVPESTYSTGGVS